jgi:hypothetical protein
MCVYYGEGIFHHNISEERPQRQKREIFPEENSANTDLCCLSHTVPAIFYEFFSSFSILNFLSTPALRFPIYCPIASVTLQYYSERRTLSMHTTAHSSPWALSLFPRILCFSALYCPAIVLYLALSVHADINFIFFRRPFFSLPLYTGS